MAWTAKQEEAIFKRNSNVIVSAGAGSGKTAVLSTRILELCKEGVGIDEVLVLTFTKAAALEMKERIAKNLKKAGLEEEAFKANNAYITTFDSYSLALVKKYYYLLGIDPNLTVADETVLISEKRKIVEEIFATYYETDYTPFLNFLRHYSLKDDKEIVNLILNISNKLELVADNTKFLSEFSNNFFALENITSLALKYEQSVLTKLDDLIDDIYELKQELDEENEKFLNYLEEFLYELEHIKSYEEAYNYLSSFSFPALKRGTASEIKDKKESVTKEIKSFISTFLTNFKTKVEMIEGLNKTKEDVDFIIEMCLEIETAIWNYKYKYQAFSFTDIAKMAIKLVSEYESVKQDFRLIKEVLVDEYQDTSDLQEAFLKAIEHNNLYMVGDIKQSIYRFRNANPYIFKNKYDAYDTNLGGYKIDLLHNFRSRAEVIADINMIFSALMTSNLGDADYKNSHQMNFGLEEYERNKPNLDFHLEDLVYEIPEDCKFKKAEIEAFIVAKKVKELVANNYTFDKNTKEIRKTKYSDIAILLDRSTNFVLFKKVFSYLGIPLSIEADLDLKESGLTNAILSLLELAVFVKTSDYKTDFRRAYVSVLRSFICEMTDEEIYEIIKEDKKSLVLEQIKNLDLSQSATTIFAQLLEVFEIYSKLPKLGNVKNSLIELESIANMLSSYNKLGFDFNDSVKFLVEVFNSKSRLKYTSSLKGKDEVQIMSIHHSKGLEYPYCIFPMLDSRFNDDDSKARFGFDLDYGIFVPMYENGLKETILRTIIKDKEREREISEKVRLFYVALTRAREKIILVHERKEFKAKELKNHNLNNFGAMLSKINNLSKFRQVIDVASLGLTNDYNSSKILQGIEQKGIKLEYNLSDQRGKVLTKGKISKKITSILSNEERTKLEVGTYYHELLETIDLKNPRFDLIDEKYVTKIKRLLALPIFAQIKEARIFQEHEFYFEKDGETYAGIIDLLLEFKDRYLIIDYKLSEVEDEAYQKQLMIYYNYVRNLTNKKVEVYLLSILKEEVKYVKF